MAREPGNSPLSIQLPKGGGDVRGLGGSFVPDYNRGTATYQVPLPLPPGRAGFRASLALTYNSGGANGAFGLGWSLGVPSISRDAERGFPAFDANDRFLLEGHGELVRLPDGRYRPRVDDLFADITLGAGWEIRRRDNGVERYGATPAARVFDPDDATRILTWALEESEDRNGNRIQYRYLRDGHNLYLSEIAYAIFRVVLVYEARPDRYGTARHGFAIETALRCRRIEIHSDRAGLLRSASLGYSTPAETPLSLLSEITWSGHRVVGGVEETESLPPIRLAYTRFAPERASLRAVEAEAGFQPPPAGADGAELVDMTGEGLPDLLQLHGPIRRWFRNRGDGSWDRPRPLREVPAGVELGALGCSFADMNGDGIADILVGEGPRPGYVPLLGDGRFGGYVAFDRAPRLRLSDANTRQVDLDADGTVDLLQTGQRSFVAVLRQGAAGWSEPRVVPRQHDAARFPDVFFADPRVHLGDMTGDGLTDIVQVHSGELGYWPYQGLLRWGERRAFANPPVLPRGHDPRRVFLTDVNGDGLADLIYVDTDSVTVWINQLGRRFSEPIRYSYTPLLSGASLRVADMFGQGAPGVVWSYPASERHPESYFHLSFTAGKPYLLTSIDTGLGESIEIAYETSTQHGARDRSAGRPWPTLLPFPLQVVASVTRRDPTAGKLQVTRINYHDGLYADRRFAGFGHVTIEDAGDASGPGVVTDVAFDHSPVEDLPAAQRALALARWGRLLETSQRDATTGELLRRATNRWDAAQAAVGADGTAVIVVHKASTRTEAFGGGDGPLVIDQTFTFDDHGNATGATLATNGPSPSERRTEIVFARDPDGRVLSLPSHVIERNGAGELVREYRMYYDGPDFVGLPLGQATRGNVSRTSVRVLGEAAFEAHHGPEGLNAGALGYRLEDGAVWSESARHAFNGHGMVTASLTPMGDRFDVEYDGDALFPVRRVDPLGFAVGFTWDDRALQPSEVVDANGAVTRLAFDALGRVVAQALPGDELVDPSQRFVYDLGSSPPHVVIDARLTDDGMRAELHAYYQASGDLLETRLRRDAATLVVSPKRTFNARGWPASEGQPELDGSPAFAPRAPLHPSTLRYDAIGRVVEVTYANGKRDGTRYEPFRTVHHDANDTDAALPPELAHFFDTPRIHRYDGLGRIVEVTELHDGLVTTHAYVWDDGGNLTAMRGPDGATFLRQTFDLVGNRLRLEHRDAGERRAYHAADGLIVRMVDAAGNRLARGYDALRRPTTTEVNGVVTERFIYDDTTRPNQRGRLSRVEDPTGTWTFDYDERGRLLSKRLERPPGSWTLAYAYHAGGALRRTVYPDGSEVRHDYDQAGQLTAVPGVVDEIRYDARGRRTLMRLANGVQTELDYDPQTAFLTAQRVRGPSGELLEEWRHTRDNVGNLLALIDGRPATTDAPHPRRFGYDARYRLRDVAGGDASGGVTPYTRRYAYDQASNFTELPAHAGLPLFYEPAGSARLAGIVVGGAPQRLYEYDANGNLVRLPGRRFQFDAFGRLVKVTRDDGRECAYEYNVAGERTWRRSNEPGSPATLFLSDLYEEATGGAARRIVYAGATAVAIDENGTRRYLHSNELGHTLLETDPVGAVSRRLKYHPFGELHSGSGSPASDGFAGKRFDELSGCYHFAARHYLPEMGRFISPDPLLLWVPERGLVNPQLHNLYAFAANNPTSFVDPYGYSFWGSVVGGLVGGFVGALVFVATGGNPILAGLAGGFAGGFVSGWIDSGSLKGAVIGGLIGAASGLISGGMLWGVSALGGLIGGYVGQEIATVAFTAIVVTSTALYGLHTGLNQGNWDVLAGMAAGMVGGYFGRVVGNHIMMRGVYADLKSSSVVRNTERQAERKLGGATSFKGVTYQEADLPNAVANHDTNVNGTIRFDRGELGNDYLDFRRTHAHELFHEYQAQTIANWQAGAGSPGSWAHSVSVHGAGMDNPYQIGAENFAMRFTNYSPYPIGAYTYFVGPTGTVLGMPASHEDRRSGEDAWAPLL